MKRPKSIKQLKKKLDEAFSKYIRIRDGFCITCGSKKSLQCGHYVSRRYSSLRWSEINCAAQCKACNIFKEGAKDVFAIKLIEIYGDSILRALAEQKNKIYKLTKDYLMSMIDYYQSKYEELAK